MPKRNRSDGLEAGSDSFLDIIANIVGILIILIVIAGVRVSRAPVTTDADEPPEVAPAEPVLLAEETVEREVPPLPIIPEEPKPLAVELPPTPEPLEPPEPPKPVEPSPELIQQLTQLKADLKALEDAKAIRSQQVRSAVLRTGALKRRLAEVGSAVTKKSQLINASSEQLAAVSQTQEQLEGQLAKLRSAIRGMEAEKPDVKTLEHRVTPMARTVTGTELHYHCLNGKVTLVPLDEMMTILKGRIERQVRWLAKFNEHRGAIGPISGFTMHYIAGRSQSVVDDLKYDGRMIRIGLKEWRLEPGELIPSESAKQAVLKDSLFLRSLLTAPKDSTLTFWVYPDSFELFRKLQAIAHARGFTVAGRPLPHGLPIAGSPQGSRSSGQ